MNFIGIDMSKNTFHAALDESSVHIFHNSKEGLGDFLSELSALKMKASDTQIGVEATGAYHLLFCMHMTKAGYPVSVINPLESKNFLKTQSLRKVKTDRKDALGIREMIRLGRGYLFSDTEDVLALKELISEREGLVGMSASLKTRQEAHRTKQKAVSFVLHDSSQIVLKTLKKEIREIEKLFQLYKQQTQTLLRSIPGIGVLTAATLVAFIGDIHRFSSPEKLVAYIGMDCRVFESGTSVKGKGYLTKRGNKYLRYILFNASFIARQYNPTFRDYFDKKISEGKHYFAAQCAVERKLIHLIYAVWTRGTPYEKR